MSDSLLKQVVRKYGPDKLLEIFSPAQLNALRYDWEACARPEQLPPPGDWAVWLLLCGRGWGKSKTGAEWARKMAYAHPGSHGALIGATAGDTLAYIVRPLLECHPPGEVEYNKSEKLLTWKSGSTAQTFTAEEPERIRGPNVNWAWCDELCAWQYVMDTWNMLQLTMRMGDNPQVVITTTPKPLEILTGDGREGRFRGLLNRSDVVVTNGSTYDNVDNLSPKFLERVKQQYEGTRLGEQELMGKVLEAFKGALFSVDDVLRDRPNVLGRVVIGVDPATTSGEDADETGIVVVGKDQDGFGYVLADYSGRYTPEGWARKVNWAYHHHSASKVVAERNQGGEMVKRNLMVENPLMSYEGIHVKHGKFLRAEPVAALYEKRLMRHVDVFDALERQMFRFMPEGVLDGHDDRVDALVHALTDLMLGEPNATYDEGEEINGRRW